jgi:hypothetical protein
MKRNINRSAANADASIKITGVIHVKVLDKDGNIIEERGPKNNTITTVGKAYLATWLAASAQTDRFMSWIGLGEGMTAATANDTELEDELDTRVQGTVSTSSNTWALVSTFNAGVDTGTITETGLFSDETSGTMLARQVFSPITKGAGNQVVVTWNVSFS